MTQISVLVIDDDAPAAESLAALLWTRGAAADWAVNAHGAIARLSLKPYSALVLDVYLPGPDGLELLRTLRATPDYGSCPVVVLTAASGEDLGGVEAELAGLGPARVLQKPAEVEEVLLAIESMRGKKGE
jgi:CheY-like chemotaxis protein